MLFDTDIETIPAWRKGATVVQDSGDSSGEDDLRATSLTLRRFMSEHVPAVLAKHTAAKSHTPTLLLYCIRKALHELGCLPCAPEQDFGGAVDVAEERNAGLPPTAVTLVWHLAGQVSNCSSCALQAS